ncbi:RHS repeat-associated core domain-containing protein, partial [Aquimarina sp. 2201CG5-10]|uniref:RHS repeat domain-containing protein n=1 Tax=Aquimarina callyspongiae TaxID=3098150 RepID=UPI002AB5A9E3
NHPEGYIEPDGNNYKYIYQYKDHLGNIRLSYADNDNDGKIDILRNNQDIDGDGDNAMEIREEKNYYPFGLEHKGYNNTITGREHNYGYNGVEEENELGLNILEMDVRQYDPAIARWTIIDPVIHFDFSPYNAFDNNPIFWADPSGADGEMRIQDLSGNWHSINSNDYITVYQSNNNNDGNDDEENCCGNKGKKKGNPHNMAPLPIVDDSNLTDVVTGNNKKNRNSKLDLGANMEIAITLEEFSEIYKGYTLSQIRDQLAGTFDSDSNATSGGPYYRYLIDPQNSNRVIDMRHFLVIGLLGEDVGLATEIVQGLKGEIGSAFHFQDFFSNRLGRQFYENITNKALQFDNPKDKASYLIYSMNNGFVNELNRFLKNR